MGKTENKRPSAAPIERLTTTQRKKAMLAALEKSLGIVTKACEMSGTNRRNFYEWLAKDARFKERVEAIAEKTVDFAESKLFELINGIKVADPNGGHYTRPPCKTAIIFYLKTKAKHRGYIERVETTGADGTPLFANNDAITQAATSVMSMTDEERAARLAEIKKSGDK